MLPCIMTRCYFTICGCRIRCKNLCQMGIWMKCWNALTARQPLKVLKQYFQHKYFNKNFHLLVSSAYVHNRYSCYIVMHCGAHVLWKVAPPLLRTGGTTATRLSRIASYLEVAVDCLFGTNLRRGPGRKVK